MQSLLSLRYSSEKHDLSTTNSDKLKERYNKYSQESRDMQDQGIHSEKDMPNDSTACNYMTDQETMEEHKNMNWLWLCG